MELALYIVNNKAIIPTTGRSAAGIYLEIEPVACIDLVPELLLQAVQDALVRGNPPVSQPSRMNYPKPAVLKYAGVNSWRRFFRIAERWSLTEQKGEHFFSHNTKDPRGAFWGGKDKVKIPIDARSKLPDAGAIVGAIVSQNGLSRM